MNPLLTLMHDTANSTCSIDGSILLLNKAIEESKEFLSIHSYNLIKGKLEDIKLRNKHLNEVLDAYYNHEKGFK